MNTLILPKQIKLLTDDIIYLESDSNYTYIYRKSNRKHMLVALSLCKIQSALDSHEFVRINRANLINIRYVRGYVLEKEFIRVTLKNGRKFRSSRRKMEAVLNRLIQIE